MCAFEREQQHRGASFNVPAPHTNPGWPFTSPRLRHTPIHNARISFPVLARYRCSSKDSQSNIYIQLRFIFCNSLVSNCGYTSEVHLLLMYSLATAEPACKNQAQKKRWFETWPTSNESFSFFVICHFKESMRAQTFWRTALNSRTNMDKQRASQFQMFFCFFFPKRKRLIAQGNEKMIFLECYLIIIGAWSFEG